MQSVTLNRLYVLHDADVKLFKYFAWLPQELRLSFN